MSDNNPDEPRLHTNEKDGSTLVYIPGGEFVMGSDAFSVERPPHPVKLSPYWMGLTEVTNQSYRRFLAETKHAPPPYSQDSNFNAGEQPVVGVDYADAIAYCEWAGLRLPTEAEWEFAARGTDGRSYPWGNEPPDPERAVYGLKREAGGKTAPVGSKPDDKSPFGVLDLAGNVLEWCSDWAASYPTDADGPLVDPTGPAQGTMRIVRGGCWVYHAPALRATERLYTVPHQRRNYGGFRVACDAD